MVNQFDDHDADSGETFGGKTSALTHSSFRFESAKKNIFVHFFISNSFILIPALSGLTDSFFVCPTSVLDFYAMAGERAWPNTGYLVLICGIFAILGGVAVTFIDHSQR